MVLIPTSGTLLIATRMNMVAASICILQIAGHGELMHNSCVYISLQQAEHLVYILPAKLEPRLP